jgi:hypothetical protein
LAFLGSIYLWNYKQEHARQRQHASTNQSEQVHEQRQSTCVDVAKKHSFSCLTYGSPAEPSEQYTEYDLRAQQDMAEWALAMVLVSALGVIVTLAATAYVALTLDATRAAVIIAEQANKTAREIGEAQVRAYLTPANPALGIKDQAAGFDDLLPVIKFQIKNTGNSPAFMTQVQAWMKLEDGKPFFKINATAEAHIFIDTIASTETSREIIIELSRSIADHPNASTSKAILMTVFLQVDWINVFEEEDGFESSYTISIIDPLDEQRSLRIMPTGYNSLRRRSHHSQDNQNR